MNRAALFGILVTLGGLVHASALEAQEPLREASGVVRSGRWLLFASDRTPNAYFAYELQPQDLPRGNGPVLSHFMAKLDHVTRHPLFLPLAIDLEGIALLAPGRPVLVSERTHTLITRGKWLADYPDVFDEIGNRGLEGVAVRRASDTTLQIAALWEGGFLDKRRLPLELQADSVVNRSLKPLLCIHTIPADSSRWREPVNACPRGANVLELELPPAPDTMQRFRAADLIWLPDGKGFLVLLTSQNTTTAPDVLYKYKWVQRYDLEGHPVGAHEVDLCSAAIPIELRVEGTGNVEGIGWFEEGKSIIIVSDYDEGAPVAILSLAGPWPMPIVPWECPRRP